MIRVSCVLMFEIVELIYSCVNVGDLCSGVILMKWWCLGVGLVKGLVVFEGFGWLGLFIGFRVLGL